jgi:hypothetical protein
MWHCIIGQVIPDVLKEYHLHLQGFKVHWPWRWRWHILPKHLESLDSAASHLRRREFPFTLLWESQISQGCCCSDCLLPEMTSSVVQSVTSRDSPPPKKNQPKVSYLLLDRSTVCDNMYMCSSDRCWRFIGHWSSITNTQWTKSQNPVTSSITHICNMQYYIVT